MMRILVAHHDARTRGRLRSAARGLQASQVKVAASPQEALRCLTDWGPDIVLMSALMAVRCSDSAAPEAAVALRAHGMVAGPAPSDGAARGPQLTRWDRDHAAVELAAVILAMEEESAEPQSLRRGSSSAPTLDALSSAEHEILAAVAAGSSPAEVAQKRGISVDVIDHHIADVLAKLQRPDLNL
jgi:DNA-binding NarL/FixJ family response regulator